MGYMLFISQCVACNRPLVANPDKAPSIRVSRDKNGKPFNDPNGLREPVCESCVHAANTWRAQHGLEPFEIHPDAYGPASKPHRTTDLR